MRIGTGFDVHAFGRGRRLILGGVEIPHELGLMGHSDADVLTHAICDAILGALGRGDIGEHFPDTDPAYKGICSLDLLEQVCGLMRKDGYEIENVDATLIMQAPKVGLYKAQIKAKLAAAMDVAENIVNIKATTTEHLGFTGRCEGVAAQAMILLKAKV